MTNPGKRSNYFLIHKDTYRFFSRAFELKASWGYVPKKKKKKLDWRGPVPAYLPAGWCDPI
jgi:DNA-binding transcriptional regulator GbsR (MarR family)